MTPPIIYHYKIHPHFPSYAVFQDGLIWSTQENKEVVGMMSRVFPYEKILIRDGHHKLQVMFKHVFIGETYHGGQPSTRHQMMHVDGQLTNNHTKNLRWTRLKKMKS